MSEAAEVFEGIESFDSFDYQHNQISHRVYHKGDGPAVIIIHELPGLTPRTIKFGERVAARGFHVYMPLLYGEAGGFSVAGSLFRLCISREIYLLTSGRSSPIVDWLRGLARVTKDQNAGKGTGVIGMCLSGGFALATVVEEAVAVPVVCQPSLPLALPLIGAKNKSRIDVPAKAFKAAKKRKLPVLCYRFSDDKTSPPERFEHLKERLGSCFKGRVIDSSPGNPHQLPQNAHAVFTKAYNHEPEHPTRVAFEEVIQTFRKHMG